MFQSELGMLFALNAGPILGNISAAGEIRTSCKHTNSWEGSSGPKARMIGNPAKIWLSNQPRGKLIY